jgi:hypothetical protein
MLRSVHPAVCEAWCVGVPQDTTIPLGDESFYKNATIAGGPSPVRAYIEELLPDFIEGRINPSRVFDHTTILMQCLTATVQ